MHTRVKAEQTHYFTVAILAHVCSPGGTTALKCNMWHLKLPINVSHTPPFVVRSMVDAFGWFDHVCSKFVTSGVVSTKEFVNVMTSRCISTSSAFSGIGTPELSDHAIMAQMQRYISAHIDADDSGGGATASAATSSTLASSLTVEAGWAVEKSSKARAELMALPSAAPKHVFGDILDFAKTEHDRNMIIKGDLGTVNLEPKWTAHCAACN